MSKHSDLNLEAVQRAMRFLNAAGAKYAIQFNGVKYGTLQLAEEAPAKPKGIEKYHSGRHGHTRRTKNDLTKYGYREKLNNAKPGDLIVFEDIPTKEAPALRGAASSYACNHFGNGSHITRVARTGRGVSRVELLIVEQTHTPAASA